MPTSSFMTQPSSRRRCRVIAASDIRAGRKGCTCVASPTPRSLLSSITRRCARTMSSTRLAGMRKRNFPAPSSRARDKWSSFKVSPSGLEQFAGCAPAHAPRRRRREKSTQELEGLVVAHHVVAQNADRSSARGARRRQFPGERRRKPGVIVAGLACVPVDDVDVRIDDGKSWSRLQLVAEYRQGGEAQRRQVIQEVWI